MSPDTQITIENLTQLIDRLRGFESNGCVFSPADVQYFERVLTTVAALVIATDTLCSQGEAAIEALSAENKTLSEENERLKGAISAPTS